MDLRPGALLGGRYRLLAPLGEGAMGTVWAARNEAIDREVAIKAIHPDVARRHPDAVPRFLHEARVCGSIRHPGIVDVLDLGQADDGTPFLVMERLHGETLQDVFARGRPPTERLLQIVRDVARTIALAHQRGIVHRDLKPANLFLHRLATGETIAKVLDFGISKVLGPESATATASGSILGSPAYMAPEQANGRGPVDARSDLFALGIILFEGLAGRLPFSAPTALALMVDIATKDVPRLEELVPGIAPDVSALVARCTARDPGSRLPSATALADAIDGLLGEGARPAGTAPRSLDDEVDVSAPTAVLSAPLELLGSRGTVAASSQPGVATVEVAATQLATASGGESRAPRPKAHLLLIGAATGALVGAAALVWARPWAGSDLSPMGAVAPAASEVGAPVASASGAAPRSSLEEPVVAPSEPAPLASSSAPLLEGSSAPPPFTSAPAAPPAAAPAAPPAAAPAAPPARPRPPKPGAAPPPSTGPRDPYRSFE